MIILLNLAQIFQVTKPIGFIIALRDLFAFLLASKRNYIDPTETINVVNDLATTLLKAVPCVGIQQVGFCVYFDFFFCQVFDRVVFQKNAAS